MLVAVIGAGRIGTAIGDALNEEGHTVHTLRSDSALEPLRTMDLDFLLLAAAPENEDKYAGFDDFRRSLAWIQTDVATDVPIASVSFLTPQQLDAVAPGRPSVRFMCSSGVGEGGLRFYDESGDERAVDRLTAALPGPWRSVPTEQYEHYTRLLIVSAVHCALLDQIEQTVDVSEEERAFLVDTLAEAQRMIEAHDGSVGDALESAMTPGGITQNLVKDSAFESIVHRLFDT